MRHLLSTADLSRDDAPGILDDADGFARRCSAARSANCRPLRGRTVMTVFYENSTRTRVSFEVAGSG